MQKSLILGAARSTCERTAHGLTSRALTSRRSSLCCQAASAIAFSLQRQAYHHVNYKPCRSHCQGTRHGTDLSHIAAALKRGLAASGGEHSLSRAGESRVVFGGSKLVSCYCVADQLYLPGNFEEGSCSINSRHSQGSVHSVQVLKKEGNLLLLVSLLIFILCLAMYMEVSAASSLLFGDWSSKVLVPTTSSLFAG